MSKGPLVLREADVKKAASETLPLTRAGRKLADAVMAAAKFRLTVDATRMVRQYEVYGIVATEWVIVATAASRSEIYSALAKGSG